jgi:hypothetical protein
MQLGINFSFTANVMDATKKMSLARRKVRADLSVRWRGGLIISIPVICLLASIFAIAFLRSQTLAARKQEQQSQKTIMEINRLLRTLIEAETGVRGYAITRRSEFLEPYSQAKNLLPLSLDSLREKVQPNPVRRQQFAKIPQLAQQQIVLLERIVQTSQVQGATAGGSPTMTERLLNFTSKKNAGNAIAKRKPSGGLD